MALLQIAEPGLSTAPHEHRLAVGIDLGTTHSLVATVRSGVAAALPDFDGNILLPSVVRYLEDGSVQVGHSAKAAQADDPNHTIASVKRWMGRGLQDLPDLKNFPYDFHDAPGLLHIQTRAGLKSPVEISAQILCALKKRAEQSLGGALTGAVITVPAYFDEAQRQATKDAAQLAGIPVLRLLNEPTAAALAYGLDQAAQGIYAIYDLGGGTFDISILRLTKGVFEVLATGGDTALGGDDFDRCLFDWALQKIQPALLSDGDAQRLLAAVRAAKEKLSSISPASLAPLSLSTHVHITPNLLAQPTLQLTIDRPTFDQLTAHLIDKTIRVMQKTLNDAQLSVQQIDEVVLVGGATRMPQLREAVGRFFAKKPYTDIDPDQVVAFGAAIQANLLAGNRAAGDDWLLLDVIPLSLGIETMGGLVEKIIPRNAPIPCAHAQEFTTFKDGQTALAIHVLQGERELATDCRSLARFELQGIPPMAAGAARIRVTYQVDADGLLAVTAHETHSGVEASITVKPSYGLSDDAIRQMLQESFASAGQDVLQRALAEQQVDAERLLEATQNALNIDADLLTASEKQFILACAQELRQALQHATVGQHASLQEAIAKLARATEEFAERRMNRSISQVLTGKTIDQV